MNSKKLLFIIAIFLSNLVYGQSYRVIDAKKAFSLSEGKIKKGTSIHRDDSVTVREGGLLLLDVESAMHLKLGPGRYDVYKEAKRHNSWYSKHLSLTELLKKKGLLACKFRYKALVVPGSDRHYEIDRIEVDQKSLVTITSDSIPLKITWRNPGTDYKGSYLLIIRDYQNHGFVDIIEATRNSKTIYPAQYGHRHLYYLVLATNCRSSLKFRIEVTIPTAFPSRSFTRF